MFNAKANPNKEVPNEIEIPETVEGMRKIRTVYYLNRKPIKANHSLYSNSAVLNAVNHLQLDHYKANVAEVYDHVSGELHAVVKLNTTGIVILYRREVTGDM